MLNATIKNADQCRYLYTVQSIGDSLHFYWQSLKMISAYEKAPLRSVDYQGHCLMMKMLLMYFECKFSMLSAQQIKFLSSSLYFGGCCNLRDTYLKSWGEKNSICMAGYPPLSSTPTHWTLNTVASKAPLWDILSLVQSSSHFSLALELSFTSAQAGRVQVRLPTSETLY